MYPICMTVHKSVSCPCIPCIPCSIGRASRVSKMAFARGRVKEAVAVVVVEESCKCKDAMQRPRGFAVLLRPVWCQSQTIPEIHSSGRFKPQHATTIPCHCHNSSSGKSNCVKVCQILWFSASEWIWLMFALEKLRTQSLSLLAHAILKHEQMTLWRLNRPTSVETRMQNDLWNEHLVFQSRWSRSKSPHTWEIGDKWPEWHLKLQHLMKKYEKHQETTKNLRPLRPVKIYCESAIHRATTCPRHVQAILPSHCIGAMPVETSHCTTQNFIDCRELFLPPHSEASLLCHGPFR